MIPPTTDCSRKLPIYTEILNMGPGSALITENPFAKSSYLRP